MVRCESRSSTIGHITLGTKQTGAPSAGNPHAGCDAAGAGNGFTVWLLRHSQRKRGATARLDLRNTAPVLDPTGQCPGISSRRGWIIGHGSVMREQTSLGRRRRRFPALGSGIIHQGPEDSRKWWRHAGMSREKECWVAHVSMLRHGTQLVCKVRLYCAFAAIHPCNCIQSAISVGVSVSSCSAGASPSPMCVPCGPSSKMCNSAGMAAAFSPM
jgi:hypothetical protein